MRLLHSLYKPPNRGYLFLQLCSRLQLLSYLMINSLHLFVAHLYLHIFLLYSHHQLLILLVDLILL